MCCYCFEVIGLSYVAALAHGREPDPGLVNYFTRPILVQEGAADASEGEAAWQAPVSAWCRRAESALSAGELLPLPQPPAASVLGAWQPPAQLSAADADRVAGALDMLRRYVAWLREVAPAQAGPNPADILSGDLLRKGTKKPADPSAPDPADILSAVFPVLWTAWLVAMARAPAPIRAEVAETIATCNDVLMDDEMLCLLLQRRAALVWHDAQGMAPILAAYGGIRLRSGAAHYIAIQRKLAAADLTALMECAERHGEGGALDALLE